MNSIRLTSADGDVCSECMDKIKILRNSPNATDTVEYFNAILSKCAHEKAKDYVISLMCENMSNESKCRQTTETEEEYSEINEIMITTGSTFEGYKVVAYRGLCVGCYLESPKLLKGFNHSDAIRKAEAEMIKDAMDRQCNAVIGLSVNQSVSNSQVNTALTSTLPTIHSYLFTVAGTGVVIEKC